LKKKAVTGCYGEYGGGLEARNRKLRAGRRIPPAPRMATIIKAATLYNKVTESQKQGGFEPEYSC